MVLLSALPWHETFYKLLNQIAGLMLNKEDKNVWSLLENIYSIEVPHPGTNLHVGTGQGKSVSYTMIFLKIVLQSILNYEYLMGLGNVVFLVSTFPYFS